MKIVLKKYSFSFYLLLLMPFIDMLSGYALNAKIDGVLALTGQAYRCIILIYTAYQLYIRKFKKKNIILLLFTIYLAVFAFINALRFNSSIVENFSSTLKLILPMYIFYFLIEKEHEQNYIIPYLFSAYAWIYPLSLIIPKILGLGFSVVNYAFDSGYRGFYYANNDLNVILMVLFVYCFQKLYDDILGKELKKLNIRIPNLINLLLIIYALLLIGSKTSILAIIIVCIAYIFKKENSRYKIKFYALFSSVGIIGCISVFSILGEQLNNILQRVLYSYNRYIDEGFLAFLLTKRNLRIGPGIRYWYQDQTNGVINFLFGIGKGAKCPDSSNIGFDPFSLIEMDFFDGLFWFGLIGIGIVIIFYISIYIRSIKIKGLFMEKTMYILVFSFSMLAGHVIITASSGTIFALVCAALYLKSNQQYRQ